jgi:hypothetical protein
MPMSVVTIKLARQPLIHTFLMGDFSSDSIVCHCIILTILYSMYCT